MKSSSVVGRGVDDERSAVSATIALDFSKFMKTAEGWLLRQPARLPHERASGARRALRRLFTSLCAVMPLMLCAGCMMGRGRVEKNLMAHPDEQQDRGVVDDSYLVGCPDVLVIDITGRLDVHVQHRVGVDGRVDLGQYGKPRAEGRTLKQIAAAVAEEAGVSVRDVHVKVAEYQSQQVYLFGEIVGWQRAVPYEGQETVLDLLQRVGGITRGAEPRDVYVVRSHLSEKQRPEVFHVDLRAIVLKSDDDTNVRVMPGDQIYVGETRRHRVERIIPPVMRPFFRTVSNSRLNAQDRGAAMRHFGEHSTVAHDKNGP